VRLERQDGVASPDHLAMTDVDAVKLAERDSPRSPVGLG
jgi:hypothetical protein